MSNLQFAEQVATRCVFHNVVVKHATSILNYENVHRQRDLKPAAHTVDTTSEPS
jgi:hypothetical protein